MRVIFTNESTVDRRRVRWAMRGVAMSMVRPCLIRTVVGAELRSVRLGHPLLDDYLEFVGARARLNTWLAAAYDLKVFFSIIVRSPPR